MGQDQHRNLNLVSSEWVRQGSPECANPVLLPDFFRPRGNEKVANMEAVKKRLQERDE